MIKQNLIDEILNWQFKLNNTKYDNKIKFKRSELETMKLKEIKDIHVRLEVSFQALKESI